MFCPLSYAMGDDDWGNGADDEKEDEATKDVEDDKDSSDDEAGDDW